MKGREVAAWQHGGVCVQYVSGRYGSVARQASLSLAASPPTHTHPPTHRPVFPQSFIAPSTLDEKLYGFETIDWFL